VALLAIAAGSLAQTLLAGRSFPDAPAGLDSVFDVPWLVAYASLTLAAVVRVRYRSVTSNVMEAGRRPSRRWIPVATVAMTFVAMPAFVYLGLSWKGDPVGYWVFAGLAGLLGLLAIGRNAVLTLENTSLRARTVVDPLTELFNHRFFHERLAVEIERARREESPLALASIDLDDFDQVNNVYGHAAGDRRLRAVAEALRRAARSTDIVCRIGGDEFALIMPATSSVDAYKVCLRLQEAARFADPYCPLATGFSAGIAATPEHAESRDDLLRKADGALYWAKLHGREQIVVYDPELIVALGPEQRIELLEEESYVRMVQLLASAVDARDPYTQQHSRRVAALAVGFAQVLGMSEDHLERLRIAALLHDVGKIGVPDAVLRKPDRLDEAEYRQVKEHPHLAVRILQAIPHADILPWIRCHHERWDGRGYPDGLAAEDIPVEARILAICDAYDAMTSSRPYRPAMLTAEALAEIDANAGTQFDADLAELFVIFMNDQQRLAARGDTAPLLEPAIA
jgi:diguanylate cyclase (GGDEF)-like protein